MPFYIKRTEDGKWVSKPGNERSYTNDLDQAQGFNSSQEAQQQACENESIWYCYYKFVSKER